MLYLTTRNRHDAYTAARVLCSDRGPDGGLYLPFRMISLTAEDVRALKDKTFGECIAETLNQFFSCRLTGRDVEFRIGRNPARLTGMSHRVLIAQTWHNEEWNYAWLENTLARRICGDGQPSGWVRIAIRIAVLVGIFGELQRLGLADPAKPVDMAVPAGDFSVPISCWYARQMGLPIANIVCGCNENGAVWDLLHLGTMRTDGVAVKTTTPEADFAVPEHLERLVCGTLGYEEAYRYSEICRKGGSYSLLPVDAEKLRRGLFAAVISKDRLKSVIPSFYRTSGYILGPYSALGYGALLDYRAKTGENRPILLLAEKSPVCDTALVCQAMDMTEQELREKINLT